MKVQKQGRKSGIFFREAPPRKRKSVRNGKKCKKLLSFAGSGEDVSDPWYTRDFVAAYEDILRGCKGILDAVK